VRQLNQEKNGMKNVFVGNMSFETTEMGLRSIFEPFGEITRVQLITDRDTGRPRGFGFVEMSTDEEAAKAITALNGTQMDGRALSINEAKPKAAGKWVPGGRGEYSRDSR
jgi:RNA recognition motif-containing protein